ncbi:effector-associated domain 2-containing protein [Amycolatopsis sp. cmx-4-83]|uniref:VMAP-C domain-containing protein n=1 Tax=Amycolatopsis sp. cmx-4-83 TaxID=2790940 RepID=UPI00397A52C8
MSAGERVYGPGREFRYRPGTTVSVREAIVNVLAGAGLAVDPAGRALLLHLIDDNLGSPLVVPDQVTGRDHLIEVVNACAKADGGMVALADAVRMMRPESRESDQVRRLVDQPRMHDLLPEPELWWLRARLLGVVPPRLSALLRRAAGPADPPIDVRDAWDAFCALSDFNTPPDGLPPALAFVEFVAGKSPPGLAGELRHWNAVQARRLQAEAGLAALRAEREPDSPAESRLHLMIVVQPDGIDPGRHLVSYWRQDDPEEWPPARGGLDTVTGDQLERHVDTLVVEAENAWAEYRGEVRLEFVLPRSLLNLPVHLWCKEHETGDPRPLFLDYPIVVRSLERMRSRHWHRAWRLRWEAMMTDPSAERVYFCTSEDTGERHRLDAILSEDQWVVMVLAAAPASRPRPGEDELAAGLRSGLPALLWHPEASLDLLREVVTWLVEGGALGDLPARVQKSRCAAFRKTTIPPDLSVVRNLVVLWDDPARVVFLDSPPFRPGSPPGSADERGRAS